MIGLSLSDAIPRGGCVLAIGSHADDIEIGCGGSLLMLTRARPDIRVTWVVLSADDRREEEARSSAELFLGATVAADVRVYDHRECFFPYRGEQVKETFEELKPVEPDVVFTHARSDLHQDHRVACELTWNTFRDHLVLEYEIPKYDGDLGAPNVFVELPDEIVDEKIRLISESFVSQTTRHWFEEDVFRALMRLRGVECASRFAEAFTCRKLLLRTGG
jgi:LmbE family N-acetylglucosaminyl deacetylase